MFRTIAEREHACAQRAEVVLALAHRACRHVKPVPASLGIVRHAADRPADHTAPGVRVVHAHTVALDLGAVLLVALREKVGAQDLLLVPAAYQGQRILHRRIDAVEFQAALPVLREGAHTRIPGRQHAKPAEDRSQTAVPALQSARGRYGHGGAGRTGAQVIRDESLRARLQLIQRCRRIHAHLLQPVRADEENLLILARLGDARESHLAAVHLRVRPQLVIAPRVRLLDPLRVRSRLIDVGNIRHQFARHHVLEHRQPDPRHQVRNIAGRHRQVHLLVALIALHIRPRDIVLDAEERLNVAQAVVVVNVVVALEARIGVRACKRSDRHRRIQRHPLRQVRQIRRPALGMVRRARHQPQRRQNLLRRHRRHQLFASHHALISASTSSPPCAFHLVTYSSNASTGNWPVMIPK